MTGVRRCPLQYSASGPSDSPQAVDCCQQLIASSLSSTAWSPLGPVLGGRFTMTKRQTDAALQNGAAHLRNAEAIGQPRSAPFGSGLRTEKDLESRNVMKIAAVDVRFELHIEIC